MISIAGSFLTCTFISFMSNGSGKPEIVWEDLTGIMRNSAIKHVQGYKHNTTSNFMMDIALRSTVYDRHIFIFDYPIDSISATVGGWGGTDSTGAIYAANNTATSDISGSMASGDVRYVI